MLLDDLKSSLYNFNFFDNHQICDYYAYRKNNVFSSHGILSIISFQRISSALLWRLQSSIIFLFIAVLLYGFCTNYWSGKPTRHSYLFTCKPKQIISYGHSWQCSTKYNRRCKFNPKFMPILLIH